MKTNSMFTVAVLAATLFAAGAAAQTATPTDSQTPPPTAAVSPASPMPTPNSVIYIPRLPTPVELSNVAAAQGLAIEKMEQTSDHITVVYRYANGQTNTIAYQLLPTPGVTTAPAMATVVPAATATVVPGATPTVVYPQPAYYYYDPYYYPWAWPWFAPVSIGIGFGYGYGGHFYGGHFGGGHFGGGHFGGGPGFHHR